MVENQSSSQTWCVKHRWYYHKTLNYSPLVKLSRLRFYPTRLTCQFWLRITLAKNCWHINKQHIKIDTVRYWSLFSTSFLYQTLDGISLVDVIASIGSSAVFTHPCRNFNDGLTKHPLKFRLNKLLLHWGMDGYLCLIVFLEY